MRLQIGESPNKKRFKLDQVDGYQIYNGAESNFQPYSKPGTLKLVLAIKAKTLQLRAKCGPYSRKVDAQRPCRFSLKRGQ